MSVSPAVSSPQADLIERIESLPALSVAIRARLGQLGVPIQDVDDVAQDVMLNVLRSMPDYRPELGRFDNWAVGFTRLAAKSYTRRSARRFRTESPIALHQEATVEQVDFTIAQAIHQAVSKLAAEDREIVKMRFQEGLNSQQIAEALGSTHMAIRKRLSRAVERMRRDDSIREALGL